MIQPSRPSLVDRFRSLLAEREEELGVSDDYGVSALSTEGIVQIYEIVLSELTVNSKPVIGELTMIAGELRDHSEGIADAICARIFQVPAEHKLSSLYLLDSIVKNIGCEYVTYFASRLPEMFCETFRQVHPKFGPSMRNLFRTWSTIFPPSVLRKIESELQFSAPIRQQSSDVNAFRSSGAPHPAHGIHVNPKYLEARRQFEHSVIESRCETDPRDVNPHKTAGRKRKGRDASASPERWSGASLTSHTSKNERDFSSSLQHHRRNPVVSNDQYDADHPGFVTSSVRSQKLPLTGNSGRVSRIRGAEDVDSPKTKLMSLPISPSRIWSARSPPSDNEFTREISHARPSPIHSKFAYKHEPSPLDGNRDNFVAEYKPDDSHRLLESSWSNSLSNGYSQQGPRALIDAYGNDRGKKTLNGESLKVDINASRVMNKAVAKSWQNGDEDEYMWEDMSPTLTNQKSNDFMSSNFPPSSLSTRASLEMPSVSISKTDFRKGYWDSYAPISMVDDSATSAKAGISILGPGCQYAARQRQDSQYSQKSWKTQQHMPQLPHHPHIKTGADMSFSTNQMSPSRQYMSSRNDKTPNTEAYFQRPSTTMLRMDTSCSDFTAPPQVSTVNTLKQRDQPPSKASSTFPHGNGNVSHPRSSLPSFSQQNQIKDHNVLMDLQHPLVGQSQLADQKAGLISLDQQRQRQAAPLWPQVLRPRNAHESSTSSFPAETSSLITQLPWNHGHNTSIHGSTSGSDRSNQISGLVSSSVTDDRRSNTAVHINQYPIHSLPPGVPNLSQMGPTFQNMFSAASASYNPESNLYSGLINSLVAQGLISATASASVQDSVEVEFNTDLSKIRYESALNSLYRDLPRKCTTCGLRFKCQEKHSSHMDWHVTKNRVLKNSKQKPSRKWFVSTSVWLSGTEAVGNDAIPKFWSNEVDIEETIENEIAVLADENQDACALCGEPFDNFYSDEIEEWMYRGAIYLNAPNGSTSLDRSQLGPIVHSKCRSASEVIPVEDIALQK